MRRWLRGTVGLVVLSLGLGAVTTYGVAWWLMNKGMPTPNFDLSWGRDDVSADVGWLATGQEQIGVAWYSSEATSLNGRRIVGHGRWIRIAPTWSLVRSMSPAEVDPTGLGDPVFMKLKERAAGWPSLAVVDRTMEKRWGTALLAGHDLSFRRSASANPVDTTTLAFMPIWRGFAVDVAFFGLAWAGVIAILIRVRRCFRVGAGMCPQCRYDMKGLTSGVCPDCGSAVKGT